MPVSIVLADDHTMIRRGLKSLIESETNYRIVGEAADGRETMRLAAELSPDIVIMDISMPMLNGIEAARQIKQENAAVKIIALSVHTEVSFVRQMLQAGASGYLVKHSDFEELTKAIPRVLDDQIYLSPRVSTKIITDYINNMSDEPSGVHDVLSDREREVLQMLAEGRSSKEIADVLYLSVKTIDSHRQNIMHKLDIDRFSDLVRYAIREGLSEL